MQRPTRTFKRFPEPRAYNGNVTDEKNRININLKKKEETKGDI